MSDGILGGNVTSCKNKSTVVASGYEEVGGIVGLGNNTTITKCSNYADISDSNEDCVGGIVGYACTTCIVEECFNVGKITGREFVGGIVGAMTYTTLKNSYNIASITGNNCVGGIIGEVTPYKFKLGYDYLYNCYNIGMISGKTNVMDCWVGHAYYLTWDYIYTTKIIHDTIGDGLWYNCTEDGNWDALSGPDSVVKSTMLTNLLNGNGAGKWNRDTSNKINNGYPYLVNNVPE